MVWWKTHEQVHCLSISRLLNVWRWCVERHVRVLVWIRLWHKFGVCNMSCVIKQAGICISRHGHRHRAVVVLDKLHCVREARLGLHVLSSLWAGKRNHRCCICWYVPRWVLLQAMSNLINSVSGQVYLFRSTELNIRGLCLICMVQTKHAMSRTSHTILFLDDTLECIHT